MEAVHTREVIGWDVVNWSKCLRVWEPLVSTGPLDCLEIGCGPGGLSLWLASKGHNVVCSDKVKPGPGVIKFHQSYDLPGNISYEAIDATRNPYSERFDVVVFKSVLPLIWRHSGSEGVCQTIKGLHQSMKPGGRLLFAENLYATKLHMFCRKRLLRRAGRYVTAAEMRDLMLPFCKCDLTFAGFLGAFGRTEAQRQVLGKLDQLIVPILPTHWRYIVIGVAEK